MDEQWAQLRARAADRYPPAPTRRSSRGAIIGAFFAGMFTIAVAVAVALIMGLPGLNLDVSSQMAEVSSGPSVIPVPPGGGTSMADATTADSPSEARTGVDDPGEVIIREDTVTITSGGGINVASDDRRARATGPYADVRFDKGALEILRTPQALWPEGETPTYEACRDKAGSSLGRDKYPPSVTKAGRDFCLIAAGHPTWLHIEEVSSAQITLKVTTWIVENGS